MNITAIKCMHGFPRWVASGVPAAERVFDKAGWRFDTNNRFWWTEALSEVEEADFVLTARKLRHFMDPAADASAEYCRKTATAGAGTYGDMSVKIRHPKALTLRKYQVSGAQWLLHRKRGILGDEMGVGKTLTALAAAFSVSDTAHILVGCPSAVADQWAAVVNEQYWAEVFIAGRGVVAPTALPRVIILPYGYASHGITDTEISWFGGLSIDVAILDEAHRLGSEDSARTKLLLGQMVPGKGWVNGIAARAPHLYLLTGTPIPSTAESLVPLLMAVRPSLLQHSPQRFREKHCERKTGAFGDSWGGVKNPEALRKLLYGAGVLLRRTKEGVLPQLPPKVRSIVSLGTNSDTPARETSQFAIQGLTVPDILSAIDNDLGEHAGWGTALAEIRQESSRQRAGRIVDWLSEIQTAGRPVIVFCTYVATANELAARMPYARAYHGGMSQTQRTQLRGDFTHMQFSVLVATIGSIGTGVDGLQDVCSRAVVVEFPWNPGDLHQAEDRLHRSGQQAQSVLIEYLIEPGSIESSIALLQAKKCAAIDKAVACYFSAGGRQDLFDDKEVSLDANTWPW